METQLTNTASVLGEYNSIPTTITSEALVVTMLDGLTVTKTADKQVWADGNLTYTILVDNKSTESYTNPTITDILDTTLVTFIPESVTIGGQKAESSQYSYDESTGKLTITLSDIGPSASETVTFQVAKKA